MKQLQITLLALIIGSIGFISCSSDDDNYDPNNPIDAVEIPLTAENLILLGASDRIDYITSDTAIDYNGNGVPSTDILNQMTTCENDDRLKWFTVEKMDFGYYTYTECDDSGINDHYFEGTFVIDGTTIYLNPNRETYPDTTLYPQIVLQNCKMERYRNANASGNDSYSLYYDKLDTKTGQVFHHKESGARNGSARIKSEEFVNNSKSSIELFDFALIDIIEKAESNPLQTYLFSVRSNRSENPPRPIPESYIFDALETVYPVEENGFLNPNENYPLQCFEETFYGPFSFENFFEYQRHWFLKGGVIVGYNQISIEDVYDILKDSEYNDRPLTHDFFFMYTDNLLHDGTQDLIYVWYYLPKDGSAGNVKITYVVSTGEIIQEIAKKKFKINN